MFLFPECEGILAFFFILSLADSIVSIGAPPVIGSILVTEYISGFSISNPVISPTAQFPFTPSSRASIPTSTFSEFPITTFSRVLYLTPNLDTITVPKGIKDVFFPVIVIVPVAFVAPNLVSP